MRHHIAIMAFLGFVAFTGDMRAAEGQANGPKTPGVDLEIVLAADVSRSIDDREFALQRKGYAAALTDPRVLAAIAVAKNRAIGFSFVEFSGDDEQHVVVDWSEIRDEEDGASVATAILAAPRSFTGRTSISAAIDFAVTRFARAKWPAARHMIDISGDGTSNGGRPITEARDEAIAAGVTINGLALINDAPDLGYSAHTHPPGGLPEYYRRNVIGGPGAFLMVVQNFGSFADAMAKKLAQEIADADGPPRPQRLPAARRRSDPDAWLEAFGYGFDVRVPAALPDADVPAGVPGVFAAALSVLCDYRPAF
jgi:Protein of unknown function (DUF1194)